MKTNTYKIMLISCILALLLFASPGLSLATNARAVSSPDAFVLANVGQTEDANIKGKDEVIYALLSSGGDVQSLFAVNHFSVLAAGSIKDYGAYSKVINLTDTTAIDYSGDTVTIQSHAGNFYYQGNMTSKELPWNFDLRYALDAIQTAPQELAGKSGKLEIHITSMRNTAIDATFYDHYMLQVSVSLDSEKCRDIQAPGATIANAGKNKMIVFTVMPGNDADLFVRADVTDFTMNGIEISAMPFSMSIELPDTDIMIDGFTELSDAIAGLNDGVGKLTDGVAELVSGSTQLTNGSSDIKAGLSELSRQSTQITKASSQISAALSQIASSLDGGGEMDLSALAQLPQGLAQLAAGLDGISGGLLELKNGFTAGHSALDAAIQSIPNTAISQEQIAALYDQTDPSQYDLIQQLIASYTAALTVKNTYNHVKGAYDAVAPTIDTLSASIAIISGTLNDISAQMGAALTGMDMTQQLNALSAGLAEMNQNYAAFHSGLEAYMNGVVALSSGYTDFHNGLSAFRNGTVTLHGGMGDLYNGTTELKEETEQLPDTIQSEIDDLLKPYTSPGFDPISFTSSQNKDTYLVQFVLKFDGIEKPEKTESVDPSVGKETIWDRFISLFKGK